MSDSTPILALNANEARAFLLKSESYCNIDLPNYINFDNLLCTVDSKLNVSSVNNLCHTPKASKPSEFDSLNHTLLSNKDGQFSWRPLKLIHPVLYVFLVKAITEVDAWEVITKRLSKIHKKISDKITCQSMPRRSDGVQSDKAVQISNWWTSIEQASLKLSLDYSAVVHADITDCYGSIYTHSIPWALHTKKIAKANRTNYQLIGNLIDSVIQNMSHGQTNGIPQGSVLMDFIAEFVLAYADLQLHAETKKIEYKIIRYRDDYRIFAHNETDATKVLKTLSQVLSGLGLRLNASKTVVSSNLIQSSIKSDKWHLLDNFSRHADLQKQLLYIHKTAEKYPNSGTIKKQLLAFYKKIKKRKSINGDINVLIAIAADIALKNPTTYSTVVAILSKLLSLLGDNEKSVEIINKLTKKFEAIPNTGLLDVWLQRITLAVGIDDRITFDEAICAVVKCQDAKTGNHLLWKSSWLKPDLKQAMETSIVDQGAITALDEVMSVDEINLFKSGNSDEAP